MTSKPNKQELLTSLIRALYENGWSEDGETRVETYRTHSLAFGGGPIVRTGGRSRFAKGNLKMTVGLNTLCIYRKPENPETISGQGRLAGRRVFTFGDWPMRHIEIRRQDLENLPQLLARIDEVAEQI